MRSDATGQADEVSNRVIAVLRRNSCCVSKPAILLGCADPGVPEKSKSSDISKGLRLTSGGASPAEITQSLWCA
jgi:hypothetical protein